MASTIPEVKKTIPVAVPYLGTEEEQAVLAVLRSRWLVQGPRVEEFEKRFCEYTGAREAVAVSSCTTALHLSLLLLGLGEGDEVICPSLSYIATANSVVHAGGVPVFADIGRYSYNLDPECVERAITPRTRAILAVHQIGRPADMQAILELGARHGIPVVEDAACAIGSEYRGQRIGAPHGRFACFSFHPRKILTTGDGGMITTNDSEAAARLRRLRQHAVTTSGISRHQASSIVDEEYPEVGYNYRMTDVQAAIGIVQLGRLEEMIPVRRQLAARYNEGLEDLDWVTCPVDNAGEFQNYQSYMIQLSDAMAAKRDGLMQALLEQGIATRRGVMAIHREAPYRNAAGSDRLPQTEAAARSTIILPLFHEMTEEQQHRVIQAIRSYR